MLRPERQTLRGLTLAQGTAGRFVADPTHRVALDAMAGGCAIEGGVAALQGRSVLVRTQDQVAAVLAMLELDGIAARMLLCPPDLSPEHVEAIMAEAEVDALVTDGTGAAPADRAGVLVARCRAGFVGPSSPCPAEIAETEWVLFTSGTTGRPKMVRHTLHSLTGHLTGVAPRPGGVVWSTFYDIRRYGGLSILVRALLAQASMVLSSAAESIGHFLHRAAAAGVTHLTGTPSHWRRALMSPASAELALQAVRLSGEIADQAVLDQLRAAYPGARITHAFASTEAGVAFEVTDGLAGFPAAMFDGHGLKSELRVEDGSLRIRSARVATCYPGKLRDAADGFVDSGDLVERRGERFHFVGRREGVINVGGEKVYPEEIEAVINRHPAVRMTLVWPRGNPVMGALVAADIVLEPGQDGAFAAIRDEVLQLCRAALPAHKVPVSLRHAETLAIAASGKMLRRHA